jgi:hypothetical protein
MKAYLAAVEGESPFLRFTALRVIVKELQGKD